MNYWSTAAWVALVDFLMLILCAELPQVHPKHENEGVKLNAEYIITAEWDVNRDVDIDLWIMTPSRTPVYYGHREADNVTLDFDNRGFIDSRTQLGDGKYISAPVAKEMDTIRGKVPGHYDVATFMYRCESDKEKWAPIKVKVQVFKLNPKTTEIFSKEVEMKRCKQNINVVSFDLDDNGEITLTDPPLAPVAGVLYKGIE